MQKLLRQAEAHMVDVPAADTDRGSELAVCPHFRIGGQTIRTVSVVARFGYAREATLDELRVELIFPADDEADAFFRQLAQVAD